MSWDDAKKIASKQLTKDEGYRRFPYKDTVGCLTIGYGRNLESVGISGQEAVHILENDVGWATEDAASIFHGFENLSPARQAVLINMTFNMGSRRISTFKKMREAVKNGYHEAVCKEMLDSKWALQVGNRARRLEKAYRDG
jgi:lysozyme